MPTERPHLPPTKNERKALPVVLLTIFLDILGFGILVPVLPELVRTLFEPAGFSFASSLILLGWLTAIYPLLQFFATPVLGQLSDRYGRRPVLGVSLVGTAIGYLVFALGIVLQNIPLLFIGRGLDGITGGNISVARAVVADVSPPSHRAKNFGLIGACFGLGFVLGPYIGARLAAPNADIYGLFTTPGWFGPAVPFWFAAILSLINALCVLFILPETHKHIDRAIKLAWTKSLENIRRAATSPALRVIFTAEFLFYGGFTFFTTFFQIYLIQRLDLSIGQVGDFYAYVGICIALTQVFLVPYLARRFKPHQIIKAGLIGNALALFIQLLPTETWHLALTAPLVAIFNGLTVANLSALVSLSAGRNNQGEVLGVEASVQALAQSVPAAISGYVAAMSILLPVIAGGGLMLVGGLIYIVFYKLQRAVEQREEQSEVPGTV